MVKLRNCIFLFSIIFYLQSCTSKKINISTKVFEIEDLKGKEIPFRYYEKMGFNLVYEDITIFEKKNKDTLTLLYVHDELKTIHKKVWKIKLKSSNKNLLIDWIDSVIYKETRMTQLNSITENKAGNLFFNILNYVDNNVYLCKVKQEYDIDYLFIEYYYPLKEKQILKNIERYKKQDEIPIYEEIKGEQND